MSFPIPDLQQIQAQKRAVQAQRQIGVYQVATTIFTMQIDKIGFGTINGQRLDSIEDLAKYSIEAAKIFFDVIDQETQKMKQAQKGKVE